VNSDNVPNGVSQPTARHSGNTANTASDHAKGRHCLIVAAKTPPNQQGSSGGQGRCPSPYDAAHLPRRITAGSRHPCLVPAMARADLLIDIVRAGAEGNQELFRRALEALITEGTLQAASRAR